MSIAPFFFTAWERLTEEDLKLELTLGGHCFDIRSESNVHIALSKIKNENSLPVMTVVISL
jgi:hypothetical protein